jgi:hypothetical protein
LEENSSKLKGVGSSGKCLGLCGSPMKSKVRILLEYKQFFGTSLLAKSEYYPIHMDEVFYMGLKFTDEYTK